MTSAVPIVGQARPGQVAVLFRTEERLNLRSVETLSPLSKMQLEPGSGKEKCPECGQEKHCDSRFRPLPFFFFPPFLFCFENLCKFKKTRSDRAGLRNCGVF